MVVLSGLRSTRLWLDHTIPVVQPHGNQGARVSAQAYETVIEEIESMIRLEAAQAR